MCTIAFVLSGLASIFSSTTGSGCRVHVASQSLHSGLDEYHSWPQQALASLLLRCRAVAGFQITAQCRSPLGKRIRLISAGLPLTHATFRSADPRVRLLSMKGDGRGTNWHFNAAERWYSSPSLAPKIPDDYVSPYAPTYYKLRQQLIEMEQIELEMVLAAESENYDKASELQEEVEKLKSYHPVLERELRIRTALSDANYQLAEMYEKDLENLKYSLKLPKFDAGHTVSHVIRPMRGVVLHVDLKPVYGRRWLQKAVLQERLTLGASSLPDADVDYNTYLKWVDQPFYVVLVDSSCIDSMPEEMSTFVAALDNKYQGNSEKAFYLPESSLEVLSDDVELEHPQIEHLFMGHETLPHTGRRYKPSQHLRQWQTVRIKQSNSGVFLKR